MMKTTIRIVTACAMVDGTGNSSEARWRKQPSHWPGSSAPAPDFSATDSYGKSQKLSDQKGKIVVLEWTNNGCPFVGKHYGSGNMQALQKKYTRAGGSLVYGCVFRPGHAGICRPGRGES